MNEPISVCTCTLKRSASQQLATSSSRKIARIVVVDTCVFLLFTVWRGKSQLLSDTIRLFRVSSVPSLIQPPFLSVVVSYVAHSHTISRGSLLVFLFPQSLKHRSNHKKWSITPTATSLSLSFNTRPLLVVTVISKKLRWSCSRQHNHYHQRVMEKFEGFFFWFLLSQSVSVSKLSIVERYTSMRRRRRWWRWWNDNDDDDDTVR